MMISGSTLLQDSLRVPRAAEPDYRLAKAYLSQDRVERHLFGELEKNPHRHFTLKLVHDGNDCFNPSTDTIDWDPTSALRTGNGGRQSPALGLGHEVDHAVERPCTETRLSRIANKPFDNDEERRVILGSETHAAKTLGEGTRCDHGGTLYRVRSPIDR